MSEQADWLGQLSSPAERSPAIQQRLERARGSLALLGGREHDAATLHEAGHATVQRSDYQIEVQLGHICNNRCVFCVSGQLTEQRLAKKIAADPVLRYLEEGAARGVRRVTFLGGEPTIQESFFPVLEAAVRLGYREIVIFTNGVRSARDHFVAKVMALAEGTPVRFTWRFSIQGATEEAHDAVTGRPGSFARIVAGLGHLAKYGEAADITANMCVNELSWRSLPAFPSLMQRHGIRQLHIDMLRPDNAGVRSEAHMRAILPRFSEMAGSFRDMLAGFEERLPGFDINLGNLPFCALPEHAHVIHHGGQATLTLTTDDRGDLGRLWDKYEFQRSDMQHPPGCSGCVFRSRCRGVPERYLAFYGDAEFQAVSEADLRRLDPGRRSFTTLVAGWLRRRTERLRLPTGWRCELSEESRARRWRIGLQPPATAPAAAREPLRLVLAPPGAEQRGLRLWADEERVLTLLEGVSEAALPPLSALLSAIAEGEQEGPRFRLAAPELAALLGRGSPRWRKLAARARRLAGVSAGGVGLLERGPIEGEAGEALGLRLVYGADRAPLLQVWLLPGGIRIEPLPGGTRARLGPLVAELQAVLRGRR